MKLNIRQVEAFRAVMLTGGMTSAAERLRITQPAVSRLVRDFEFTLRLELFQRRGNHVIPTSEAFDILAEVERSFSGLDYLSVLADNIRNTQSGMLRIAAMPAMASHFLPDFIASFCSQRPEVGVQIDGFPSHMVIERVASGLNDIGICSMSADRPSVEFNRIKGSAVVVIPEHHRLASRKKIEAKDLEGETIVMLGQISYLRHSIESALSHIKYRTVMTASLSTAACVLVRSGNCITIVDPFSASEFNGRGVRVLPFLPSISVGYSLIRSKSRPASHLAAQFMSEFFAHAEQVSFSTTL